MNRLKDLREQRAAKEARMKAIMDLCATEKRNRKPEEKTEWDNLKAEVDAMRDEISALEEQEAIDQRSAKPVVDKKPEGRTEKKIVGIAGANRAWQEANKETIDAVLRGEQRSLPQIEFRADDPMTIATVNAGSSVYLPNAGANLEINDLVRTKPTFWSRLRK